VGFARGGGKKTGGTRSILKKNVCKAIGRGETGGEWRPVRELKRKRKESDRKFALTRPSKKGGGEKHISNMQKGKQLPRAPVQKKGNGTGGDPKKKGRKRIVFREGEKTVQIAAGRILEILKIPQGKRSAKGEEGKSLQYDWSRGKGGQLVL